MKADYRKHVLEFIKPAATSRGSLLTHDAYFIELKKDSRTGVGEASPLPGLSIDYSEIFEEKVKQCCSRINEGALPHELELEEFPSLRFAFETAFLSLAYSKPFTVFESGFQTGAPIPINGLVWMDTKEEMLRQALTKLEEGFRCIKFKIGALDFDEECRLLEAFRNKANAHQVEIRLDANGAFTYEDVFQKLKDLKRFEIHSIEQPIKQGQHLYMQEVSAKSPVAIAFDEELIGIDVDNEGEKLLKFTKPTYIIIKPTLIGGFSKASRWIQLATKQQIGWWATSALESNVGLNAIAQWISTQKVTVHQGLGTGQLFKNNIHSPLSVQGGLLYFDKTRLWAY